MHRYVIRVEGVLSADALRDFGEMMATRSSVQTVLLGDLPDQACLAGIINHLDTLGIEIVEVLRVPEPGDEQGKKESA